jgi:hypothetical protein
VLQFMRVSEKNKGTVNLSVHQDGRRSSTRYQKYCTLKLASPKFECHAIKNKYTEADSVVQQVYKVLSDTENFASCTPAKVGKSSEWTSIMNSAQET